VVGRTGLPPPIHAPRKIRKLISITDGKTAPPGQGAEWLSDCQRTTWCRSSPALSAKVNALEQHVTDRLAIVRYFRRTDRADSRPVEMPAERRMIVARWGGLSVADTGENREIRQRTKAHEKETAAESKKLSQTRKGSYAKGMPRKAVKSR